MTQVTRELIELAERVEKAEGADRELDAAIAVAALGFFECMPRWDGGPIGYGYLDEDGCRVEPGHGGMQLIREFTASLDAAMSLVPDNTGWAHWSPIGKRPSVAIETDAGWGDWHSARTLPLALVSAALRARSAATL